ncbi:MAG: triple tyrosine motif-containing protein [Alphaproteobacteria bacterium]|nr:triple tyrosine motif-containing protein [Alphaproteobacteria bacterium]
MARGFRSVLIMCLAMVLGCPPIHAQDRDRSIRQFHHTTWTAKDGAPPEIWALDQGPDGFLWLGTGTGLFRFDGVRFERLQAAPGERLFSIDITSIKVVATNEIWIGYSDGGVSHLKDGHVTTYLEKDGIAPGMVVNLRRDNDGALWAVSHGGLSRFEGGRWRRAGADWNVPSGMVIGLFQARDGTLWLSTEGSIYFSRPGARRFEPTGAVTSHATFTQTPDGRMWIADGFHGLRPLPNYPAGETRSTWTLKAASPRDALSASNYAIDRDGAIWATDTANGGIFRFNPHQSNQPTHSVLASGVDVFRRADGLTADRSGPILCDREGNIWVGTNAGLNRFRNARVIHETAVPGWGGRGYSIAATPDGTYISDGVSLYRAAPNEPARAVARLSIPGPTILLATRDGALWYGNNGFVHRLRDSKDAQIPMPKGVAREAIRTMVEDGSGTLWVAFRSSVYKLKDGAWSDKLDLGGLPVPEVAESDPAGSVWFGYNDSRISRHDAAGTRVFSASEGLTVGRVDDIAVRDGAVWVSGSFGVALLDKGRFRTVGPDRVAPFYGVSGIGWTTDGDFLFNGLLGVVRMKAEEVRQLFADPSHVPTYEFYDRTDGLPGVAQQGWHTPSIVTGFDGRTWVISNTGVSYFNAAPPARNQLPPPVTILSATADGVSYPLMTPPTFREGTSLLAFTYVAGSLTKPESVRFRYRLEGLNPDWIEAGTHREAVFNNLGPGTYRFQVIAANEDGVWNTDGATLAFDIPPTFFQSWPFKVFVALTLAGLLWFAYSLRLRAVVNRMRMRMAERMEERERIARELHDTLLQSVQGLTLRFQLAVDDLPAAAPARPVLEEAIDRADQVIAEGRDRVRDLRSLQDAPVEEIIANIVKRQAFDPGVEVAVTTTRTPRALDPLILDEVTRIASEAVFNIWRHANAKRVAIDIGYGTNFSLCFTDNGVGIAPEVADKGEKDGHFGLSGMRERAKKLRGWLAARRLPEGGTEVMLVVPGAIAYKAAKSRLSFWS